jgi:phytoene/squalene synthetase
MKHNQREIFDTVAFECSKSATRAYSTSFSSGIRMLNNRFRNPVYGVYGFVRYADEIVDTLHEYDKKHLMSKFREDTVSAIESKISMNPVLHAFRWSITSSILIGSSLTDFLLAWKWILRIKNMIGTVTTPTSSVQPKW